MKKGIYISLLMCAVVLAPTMHVFSQTNFTKDDYRKACWMTTRMYGGQRSGDGPNWLIMNHTPKSSDMSTLASAKGADVNQLQAGKCFTKDADGTHSLSGGWVDCGDHVKFGQTMFYSAYTLLKGYAEFPAGYDDYYSFDYSGYKLGNDFTWEGKKGKPNGIPDILDELKYQTDFLIKCARNSTTFYSQVGEGGPDHMNWVTSVAMATLPKDQGGQKEGTRNIVKNPNDASMPSFAAATLALMSRMYAPFDPAYAALCLTHAKYAYDYAKSKRGNTVAAGSFYPANAKWEDDYATACAELYWATGTEAYKTEALSYAGNLGNHNWCYNYNNNDDIAAYNLAKLGSASALTLFNSFVTTYKGAVNAAGLYTGGDGMWGPLRYNANSAFIVALHGVLNNSTTVDPFIYKQVDYILGSNPGNFSFVVGFKKAGCTTCKYAERPHHRNVFLIDDIMYNQSNMVVSGKNVQHGYMLGGSRNSSGYVEDIKNYQTSEGGIDYNAGLVGAIAYIISRTDPVDVNKFGHPTPELGDDKSLCGTGSATLTATVDFSSLKPGETVTYKWYKGTATTPFEQGDTKTSVVVTQADTYRCDLVEKSGKWTTSDVVTVTAVLPNVNLGADVTLCEVTSKVLDAGVSGTGISYTWKKNNTTIVGATAKTYTVYSAGTYSVTVAASGCTSKTDEVIITSQLPTVKHDTICASGVANLSVLTAGTYAWYDVATGGTALASGTSYSPSITANKTYYVQDASSVNGSVGPTTLVSASTSNWGVSNTLQMAFTVGSSFTVNSIKIPINSVYGAGSGTVSVEILNSSGNAFSPAKIFTSSSVNITTAMAGTLVTFPFTNFAVDKAWGTNLRIRVSAVNFNGAIGFNESGASYPYNSTPSGVMTITGAYNGGESKTSWYLYFYDWKISAGSTCSRAPALAVIDPSHPKCAADNQAPTVPGAISFTNVTLNSLTASWPASTDNVGVVGYEVLVNGTLHSTVTTNSITLSSLACNTQYTIRVRAKDAAGNVSAYNTAASTTTLNVAAPTITNSTPSVCAGGTISMSIPTISGGTYAWTGPNSYSATTAAISRTNATTTMGGTYSVTLTQNGCTSTASTTTVAVNAVPAAPTITNSTLSVCAGGTISMSIPTVSGGTYAWTGPNSYSATTAAISRTNATTTMGGTYSVTLTQNGCTSTASTTTVAVNAVPAAPTITNSTPSVCVGGTISMSIPTVSGGTYAWTGPNSYSATTAAISRTNATTTMGGTYSVTLTQNGCTSTASTTTVAVNAVPAAPGVVSPLILEKGSVASPLTASGTSLLWYQASTGGQGSAIAPVPSTSTVGSQCYYVSQTVSGCESSRAVLCVDVIESVIVQTISLVQGWNLISINVLPTDNSVQAIFANIASHVEIVKNDEGFYKTDGSQLNQSLKTIEVGKSYLVKMKTSQTLSVSGTSPSGVSVNLSAGWNMLGYPKNITQPTTTVFSPIWNSFHTIKNFDGFLDKTSGTLTELSPGEGYYIYMNAPAIITF